MRCAVQVGVAVYVIERETISDPPMVLMVHHRDDQLWRVPGGGRSPLEDLTLAARRELAEEVGIDVPPGSLHQFMYDITNHLAYGEWLTFHFSIYSGGRQLIHPQVMEPKLHDGLTWMSIEEATTNMRNQIFEPTLKGLDRLWSIHKHWGK